jgi:hypothetical protein
MAIVGQIQRWKRKHVTTDRLAARVEALYESVSGNESSSRKSLLRLMMR